MSSGNTFGTIFMITTWGESHGPATGVVIDGCPAGLPLSEPDIQAELDRRKPGQSDVTTARKEEDKVEILSGIFEGKTTGTPISMLIRNRDVDSGKYLPIRDTPRPGQADFTYEKKYGIRDFRGGGRASARETAARVAAGAVAKKLLLTCGIEVIAHVIEIGCIRARPMTIDEIKNNVSTNPVRCADPEAAEKMHAMIHVARSEKDSLGGIVEVMALGVPAGIGEPVFDKLSADLAKALMSIGAVKGVEIGAGFDSARRRGSQMNDEFIIRDGTVRTRTNNAGGILGGISTGEPIICRVAVKPTPSISKTQCTVNLKTMEETAIEIEGRHDPVIPPRVVPVVEAMTALVLTDHMMRSGRLNPERV